jgi:hypothetical protein
MSAFAYTNTSDTRQQLCSAEGRAKMDECARCIDDTWSFSTYEESARFEYKAVLAACDLPDVSVSVYRGVRQEGQELTLGQDDDI